MNAAWPKLYCSYSSQESKWLSAGRFCMLALALASAAWFSFLIGEQVSRYGRMLYEALLLCFFADLTLTLCQRGLQPSPRIKYLQLGMDLLIINGIIYVTGGALSPFIFLYLPIIMIAAIVLGRRDALLFSMIAAASYAGLVSALNWGALPALEGSEALAAPAGGLILQIIGLFSAMILVAVATTFLIKTIRSRDCQVEESKHNLLELAHKHSSLINSIPTGIITTDLQQTIVTINRAALDLLKGPEDSLIGKPLQDILKIEEPLADLNLSPGQEIEGELEINGDPKAAKKHVKYHGQLIRDALLQPAGVLFTLQDVTELRAIEEQLELQERVARLLSRTSNYDPADCRSRRADFVGESAIMLKVYNLIDRVAPTDATVLINGESGTGKEVAARSIHLGSKRADGPFVPVNCSAIPENLIESELFGHKKGSFTGAHCDSAGLFRQAAGGTIFLDEVGELPVQMQAKLLRTIQEKTVHPVGGERDIPVNVRIIAATNKNLKHEVSVGNFREDLYYRLNVVSLSLPPLRERKEDIPLLADSLLRRFVKGSCRPVITPQAMQFLLRYDYPGNVRELENILERALVLGGEVVLPDHLSEIVRNFGAPQGVTGSPILPSLQTNVIIDENITLPADLDRILARLERKYLEAALIKTGGVKKRAAELLGINFRSIRYRLQKFGMTEEPTEEMP